MLFRGPESEFLNFADYTECIFNSSGSSKTRSITFCFFKYCEYKIDILNMSEEEAFAIYLSKEPGDNKAD